MSQAHLQPTQAANTIGFPKWINRKAEVLEVLWHIIYTHCNPDNCKVLEKIQDGDCARRAHNLLHSTMQQADLLINSQL